jgi:hypothetical protein
MKGGNGPVILLKPQAKLRRALDRCPILHGHGRPLRSCDNGWRYDIRGERKMVRRFPRLKFDLDKESFSPAHLPTEQPQCSASGGKKERKRNIGASIWLNLMKEI